MLGGCGSLLVIHHTEGGGREAPEQAASVEKEKNYEEGTQYQPVSICGYTHTQRVQTHMNMHKHETLSYKHIHGGQHRVGWLVSIGF